MLFQLFRLLHASPKTFSGRTEECSCIFDKMSKHSKNRASIFQEMNIGPKTQVSVLKRTKTPFTAILKKRRNSKALVEKIWRAKGLTNANHKAYLRKPLTFAQTSVVFYRKNQHVSPQKHTRTRKKTCMFFSESSYLFVKKHLRSLRKRERMLRFFVFNIKKMSARRGIQAPL